MEALISASPKLRWMPDSGLGSTTVAVLDHRLAPGGALLVQFFHLFAKRARVAVLTCAHGPEHYVGRARKAGIPLQRKLDEGAVAIVQVPLVGISGASRPQRSGLRVVDGRLVETAAEAAVENTSAEAPTVPGPHPEVDSTRAAVRLVLDEIKAFVNAAGSDGTPVGVVVEDVLLVDAQTNGGAADLLRGLRALQRSHGALSVVAAGHADEALQAEPSIDALAEHADVVLTTAPLGTGQAADVTGEICITPRREVDDPCPAQVSLQYRVEPGGGVAVFRKGAAAIV